MDVIVSWSKNMIQNSRNLPIKLKKFHIHEYHDKSNKDSTIAFRCFVRDKDDGNLCGVVTETYATSPSHGEPWTKRDGTTSW